MKKEIGKVLKLERVKRDLTLKEAASVLNTSSSTISQAERGRWSDVFMSTLADMYGYDLIINKSYELKKREDEESNS